MSIALRPYQSAALEQLREAFGSGLRRLLLYSPTGSGKTEMALEMIRGACARHHRTLFVTDRVELISQASRRLFRAGITHGIIQGSNTRRPYEPILVCSIQTLARRGFPPGVGLIVIDEAHACAGSKDYIHLLKQNQVPVVGLSATPFSRGLGRYHEELGGGLFEAIVPAVTIRELIDQGYLVDLDIYAPGEPDLTDVQITAGDYNERQLSAAVDKPQLVGDIVSHWQRLAQSNPTVVFATNIAHSRHIVEQFRAAGLSAEHLDCHTDDGERRAVLDRLANGQTRVVSNVGVLAEGWDEPCVEVMICARPTRSLIRWIQMAGRILRPFQGKSRALILDHSGTATRLGFPTDDLPLVLDDGNAPRARPVKPKERLPQRCSSCSYLKPAGVRLCPACGFAPERQDDVKTAKGTLALLRPERATQQTKQSVYAQLIALQEQFGYAPGWVAHKYRAYFGIWPSALLRTPRDPTPEIRDWVLSQQIRWAKMQGKQDAA